VRRVKSALLFCSRGSEEKGRDRREEVMGVVTEERERKKEVIIGRGREEGRFKRKSEIYMAIEMGENFDEASTAEFHQDKVYRFPTHAQALCFYIF
jgi:hypothetical protein